MILRLASGARAARDLPYYWRAATAARGENLSATTFPTDQVLRLPSGLRLAYRDWGGEGQPVVLVHGLASSYRIWDFVGPRLSERFRVVALDQRGHGRSDRPEASFDFATYVADLREFIELLGFDRAVLVGHSWGGNVVLQFGVDEPARTAGLALVDGGFLEISSRPGWTWERARQELAPPQLDGLTRDELLARASQGDLGSVWNPAVADALLGHFEQLPDGRVRPWLRREHHMRILRALWEHHPSQLWSRLQCPVLMVPARRPNAEGRQAEMFAAKEAAVNLAESRLARGRTVWMEDTFHDIPLQRPDELAAAIADFAASDAVRS
jgi:pimeloyl-ACP methyl ester carboxylesterase